MEQPTQEQIKEFWEWCGWEYYKEHDCWCDPSTGFWGGLPDTDLNNLFKYAVPKLDGIAMSRWSNGEFCFHASMIGHTKEIAYLTRMGHDKDPALALFWALWQVKESVK